MKAVVISNATVDETFEVDALPVVGESLIGRYCQRDLGGKGANVAVVMARCGIPTTLVAAIGADEYGAFVRDRLSREPLALALLTIPDAPTDRSLIYRTATGDNAIVTTTATTVRLEIGHADAALASAAPGDLLLLQGNLGQSLTTRLIDRGHDLGMLIVLNPSPVAAWLQPLIGRVHSLFANEGEARMLTGRSAKSAGIALIANGLEHAVLTLGSHGADLYRSGDSFAVEAVPAKVVDTTGAGDTFMATALASAAMRSCRLDRLALEQAAAAAALTISRSGTLAAFPTCTELAAILQR